MAYKAPYIDKERIDEQLAICADIKNEYSDSAETRYALVDTYGCQQNEADSEKLRGFLREMGFSITEDEDKAELIIVNTCAIREGAEMRVLGNVGALVHKKARNPKLVVAVCGCMVQQEHMSEKLKKSFRVVDLVFGPHEVWRFPELYRKVRKERVRVFETSPGEGVLAEGIPLHREGGAKAWLSVMYGCNNFCTYCIVPHVRGRERSRRVEDILNDARKLIAEGVRDITLLGQNVNSYGRDSDEGVNFSELLRRINALEGDFLIRFMTSHPRDATEELFITMAQCDKCAKQLHLPVQSGSTKVLKAMNRYYNREDYLKLIESARVHMPDLVISTDIIVGFPGETAEDFDETISLIEKVRYDAMFTFIFSPRRGTPAFDMLDNTPKEEKQERFDRLVKTANAISAEIHAAYVGKRMRVLVDAADDKGEFNLNARTNGGRLVRLKGDADLVGSFCEVLITGCNTWALEGSPILGE